MSADRGWLGGALGTALLAVASLAVGLLLVELTLHLLDVPSSRPFFQEFVRRDVKLMAWDANPAGAFDVDLRDPAQRAPWETLFPGDEFARHWAATPFGVEVRFNSLRFRDREFEPKRDGVRRVVVIGDSFTYGHGLPERECYPRQLESMLRTRHPEREVEVYNCGFGGDNLDRIVGVAAGALTRVDPDVLVYGYFLNDPSPTNLGHGMDVHPMFDAGWLHPESAGPRYSLGARPPERVRLWELLRGMFEQRHVTAATIAWYREIHEPARWQPTLEQIAAIDQAARGAGCRFVVIVLPPVWHLDGDYPFADIHAHVTAALRSRGIEVVDALPALRGHPDRELMIHPHDRHPTAAYARIVAATLADTLGP